MKFAAQGLDKKVGSHLSLFNLFMEIHMNIALLRIEGENKLKEKDNKGTTENKHKP